jgi:pyrimidine deaminase RibD-like protein
MSPYEKFPEHPFLDNAAELAIKLAERSALINGKDIPVGAIALFGAAIVGTGYASDGESGLGHLHAEVVALEHAYHDPNTSPTIVVSTLEPCDKCQDTIAEIETVSTVAYVTPRTALSDRQLVMNRPSIEERAARFELPYKVIRLDNPLLTQRALEPLDYTTRDLSTGITKVDSEGFRAHIAQRTV